MSCNSLKQNFIFLLKDNNLSQKYQVVEEFVDNQFGFNADFFITITTEAESQVKHGQLDAGQKVQTSEQAKKQAEDQLRELINFEFDKVSSSTSQLLRKQTVSCILKSENFYLVKKCESCSARGKISCRACDANGHVRCRSCSGLGKSKCESCNGYGVFSCSSCIGTGKVAEYNRSIDDDIMDTLHKNYGGPVYRSCSACNGNGRKTCVSCGGSSCAA